MTRRPTMLLRPAARAVAATLLTLSLAGCDTGPKQACQPVESAAIQAFYLRVYDIGLQFNRTGDLQLVQQMLVDAQQLNAALTPSCRNFLERLDRATKARGTPWPPPADLGTGSVMYDASSDTYMAPGGVSCGPSGCLLP